MNILGMILMLYDNLTKDYYENNLVNICFWFKNI